jgi:flagellar FliJ protein
LKKFAFDLENILELRKYREQEAEVALGRAVGELTRIEQKIEALIRERIRASGERFALGYGVAELVAFDRYVQRLDITKEVLIEDAAKAAFKVEEARKSYIEASNEREALDKVKEGEAKDHRKQGFAEEAKALDDISGDAYVRKAEGRGIPLP